MDEIVDSRMTKDKAKKVIAESDGVWLAGGHECGFNKYVKTAIFAGASEYERLLIYEALGIVDFFVIPHFNKNNILDELITISKDYPLYGISDNSAIFYVDKVICIGEVFVIEDGRMIRL